MHRSSVIAALSLLACSAPLPTEKMSVQVLPVVYGRDDRCEMYEIDDPAIRRAASAVAAIIPRDHFTVLADGTVRFSRLTAAGSFNLCADERFSEQPALASCTAALIDDDLVVTAGHCFAHAFDCENFVFAFDYAYRAPGDLAWGESPELFECARTLVQQTVVSSDEPQALDFAVVQLTRPVVGRMPLALRPTALMNGERINVVSATLGVPLKIDRGGQVLDARSDRSDFFVVDSDTFHGSSGAPVLDDDGALLGIFVRGHEDFGYDAQRACSVVSVRSTEADDAGSDSTDAEEATHIARAIDAMCAAGHPSARLCGTSHEVTERDAGTFGSDAGPHEPEPSYDGLPPGKARESGCAISAPARTQLSIAELLGFGSLVMLAWLRRRGRARANRSLAPFEQASQAVSGLRERGCLRLDWCVAQQRFGGELAGTDGAFHAHAPRLTRPVTGEHEVG